MVANQPERYVYVMPTPDI